MLSDLTGLTTGAVTRAESTAWSSPAMCAASPIRPRRSDVTLNAVVPWDIEIVGGAGKLQGKLTSLDIRSFELTGGVDRLRLTLGRPTGDVPIRLTAGVNVRNSNDPPGSTSGWICAAAPAASTSTSNGSGAPVTRPWNRLGPTRRPIAT